jgi:hypothetical protein
MTDRAGAAGAPAHQALVVSRSATSRLRTFLRERSPDFEGNAARPSKIGSHDV